jgi:glycosyltransferase involved in cell wall biosynthesis
MKAPCISLIATTYNQPRELSLYLETVAAQTWHDFELLVADDGSAAETREVIESSRVRHPQLRFKHVWHPDQGYQKSKILNQAIRQSEAPWIVFTDSDLILHPRFLADHAAAQKRWSLFMGRRVELAPGVSRWVVDHPEKLFGFEFYRRVLRSSKEPGEPTKNANRSFRIANSVVARIFGYHKVPDLLGSNFSICRELLLDVNGFDEKLEHYWGEDGDLFIRARNAGAKIHGRKAYAVQFHLWHKRRAPALGAEEAYREKLKNREYRRCVAGLL